MTIDFPSDDLCEACEAIVGRDTEGMWSPVLSTNDAASFITDRQRSPFSVLVLPRRHANALRGLTDPETRALGALVHRLATAVHDACHPDGMHIWTSAGRIAGQSMSHMHVQIVPRVLGACYSFAPSTEVLLTDRDERETQAHRLQQILALSKTGVAVS